MKKVRRRMRCPSCGSLKTVKNGKRKRIDFSLMTKYTNPLIDDVIHKSYLEVNVKEPKRPDVASIIMAELKSIQSDLTMSFVMIFDCQFICLIS